MKYMRHYSYTNFGTFFGPHMMLSKRPYRDTRLQLLAKYKLRRLRRRWTSSTAASSINNTTQNTTSPQLLLLHHNYYYLTCSASFAVIEL